MHLNVSTSRICLEPGQVVTLDDAEGVHLRTTRARLWVTEEGDASDFVVNPGEDFVVTHPGRTIIQALEPTWLDLEEQLAR
jgi:hypothetical protein